MRNFKRTLSFITSMAVVASTFSAMAVPANAAAGDLISSTVIGNGSNAEVVSNMTVSDSETAGALSVAYGETGLLFPTNRISATEMSNEAVITLTNPIDISENDVEITWTLKAEVNTYSTNGKRVMTMKDAEGNAVLPPVIEYNWGSVYFNYETDVTTPLVANAVSKDTTTECKIRIYTNADDERVCKMYVGDTVSDEYSVNGDNFSQISLSIGNLDNAARKLIVDNLTVSYYEPSELTYNANIKTAPYAKITYGENGVIYSDAFGNAVIRDLSDGTNISYTVEKGGYESGTGEITINGDNAETSAALVPAESNVLMYEDFETAPNESNAAWGFGTGDKLYTSVANGMMTIATSNGARTIERAFEGLDASDYTIEYDVKNYLSNANKTGQKLTYTFTSADGTIAALTQTCNNAEPSGSLSVVGSVAEEVKTAEVLNNTQVHVKIEVSGTTAEVTVTSGENVLMSESFTSAGGALTGMKLNNDQEVKGEFDNFIVTKPESEEPGGDDGEPTAPPTATPTAPPTAAPVEPVLGNSVSISEPFGSSSAESPVNGENYTWGALTIADSSYQGMSCINTGAVSLTENKGLDLITFTNGVGGADKDISVSFDGGTVKGFGQADYTWDLVFKDTSGTEMFRYRYISGGWAKKAGLVIDGVFTQVDFSHADNVLTNFPMYVSFNYAGGGNVTLGSTTLPFAKGQSLGAISIENSGSNDWNRSLVIDNVSINTVDKNKVTCNITSSEADKSAAGAEMFIEGVSYKANDEGVVTAYYLPGTYEYTIKCAEHAEKNGTITVSDTDVTENIVLDYVGPAVVSSIVLGGGDEYIYLPASGEAKSSAFTATIYDNAGLVMEGEEVTWSLPGAAEGVSIDDNGVITLLPSYQLTDDNGVDLTIRATSKSVTTVSADITIHINNTARITTFDVVGPMVVKDGQTAEFSVTNTKDQYGNAYTADDVTYSISTNNEDVVAEGMTITPNIGTAQTAEVEIVVTASTNEKATAKRNLVVYGYDFYEPGAGQATYGDPRMEVIGDNSYIVWPKSAGASATTTIDLPVPVKLEAGTAKMISFKTAWTVKTVGSQERSLQFNSSNGTKIVKLGYNGGVGVEPVKVDGNYVFTGENSYVLGSQGAESTWEETIIVLKTDSNGVTTAQASYAGGPAVEFEIGENLNDIASIQLIGGSGAPDDRLLGIRDVRISDSDVAEVEISGDNYIARIEGRTATKKYKGSVFATSEGETFSWSCTPIYGDMTIEETTSKAVLVPSVSADSAVIIKAVYNDNKFAGLTAEEISGVEAGKTIEVEAEAGTKVLLWNSLSEMKPLAEAAIAATVETPPTDVPTDAPTEAPGADNVYIDNEGVLYVPYNTTATAVEIKYASDLDENKYATKTVEIKDYANVESFVISGPSAVNAGETVTYKAVDIIDEYGDKVEMNASYALTKGSDIASIDATTGVLTTSSEKTGEIEVSVTVGNTGMTKTLTMTATIGKFAEVGVSTGASVVVDVTKLANYSTETMYLVSTAKDGKLVNQTEVKSTDGNVTVDTAGSDSYEVSPIYSYSNVGNVANGFNIPLSDGLYDFTFKKANGERADIFVNGNMVGQNVDQYGAGRSTSGSYYTVKDVKVSGGNAVVTMRDTDSNMESIVVKKAPSIVDRKTHVYILGDSLVANYYDTFADADGDGVPAAGDAQTGWGQVFDKFVTDDMNVTNLAESGNYAKGLYDSVFHSVIFNSEPGDYLLFECGYNDKKYSTAVEMQNTVKLVQQECDEKGITVIFVTPNASVHGTGWKQSVQLASDLIEVSQEIGAKYIDLSSLSFAYYSTTKADDASSREYTGKNFNVYFDGAQQDQLHSSYYGALKNAEIVAQAIYDMQKTDEELAGLRIDTSKSYVLKDSEGADLTFQVK